MASKNTRVDALALIWCLFSATSNAFLTNNAACPHRTKFVLNPLASTAQLRKRFTRPAPKVLTPKFAWADPAILANRKTGVAPLPQQRRIPPVAKASETPVRDDETPKYPSRGWQLAHPDAEIVTHFQTTSTRALEIQEYLIRTGQVKKKSLDRTLFAYQEIRAKLGVPTKNLSRKERRQVQHRESSSQQIDDTSKVEAAVAKLRKDFVHLQSQSGKIVHDLRSIDATLQTAEAKREDFFRATMQTMTNHVNELETEFWVSKIAHWSLTYVDHSGGTSPATVIPQELARLQRTCVSIVAKLNLREAIFRSKMLAMEHERSQLINKIADRIEAHVKLSESLKKDLDATDIEALTARTVA